MTERDSENSNSMFSILLGGLAGLVAATQYLAMNGVPVNTVALAWVVFLGVTAVVTTGSEFVNERVL